MSDLFKEYISKKDIKHMSWEDGMEYLLKEIERMGKKWEMK